jgi:hypothetical protein
MPYDEISEALSTFNVCERTADGVRITTHCLYPSFETVYVFVSKIGDGYRIHDGRGAFEAAWLHGREPSIATKSLEAEGARFHLSVLDGSLVANVSSLEWLCPAILSVANASASAANHAIARAVAAAEEALIDRVGSSLARTFRAGALHRKFTARGKSGKEREFDFAVRTNGTYDLLVSGVVPHAASIAAKYVVFSDTEIEHDRKLAVYDRALETGDTALLQQVASIVPLSSLSEGARRAIHAPQG